MTEEQWLSRKTMPDVSGFGFIRVHHERFPSDCPHKFDETLIERTIERAIRLRMERLELEVCRYLHRNIEPTKCPVFSKEAISFVGQILRAEDGDDTPRLVFADWLGDRGQDEQASWMRGESGRCFYDFTRRYILSCSETLAYVQWLSEQVQICIQDYQFMGTIAITI